MINSCAENFVQGIIEKIKYYESIAQTIKQKPRTKLVISCAKKQKNN